MSTPLNGHTPTMTDGIITVYIEEELREAAEAALAQWDHLIEPDFVIVDEWLGADMRIRIGALDGAGERLASAFASGLIRVDEADYDRIADQMATVLAHEIGHVLGLDHTGDDDSIMQAHLGLLPDRPGPGDIVALQGKYGADAGDNFILGHDADNIIFGGAGDDTILGFDGNDMLGGGDGDDWLITGSGDDVVYGGAGDDVIIVEGGANVIYVGSGANWVIGATAADTIYGIDDDDVIFWADGLV